MDNDSRKFVEHRPMGGYSASLNTIPHHVTFLAECRSCGRRRELDRELLETHARMASVDEMEPRLRCRCGEKNTRLMTGYWVAEMQSGPQTPIA